MIYVDLHTHPLLHLIAECVLFYLSLPSELIAP
jgi:hypothetical protein